MFKNKPFVTKILSVFLALCLVSSCCACASVRTNGGYVSKTFWMMDTVIEIKLRCDTATAKPIWDRCAEFITDIEQTFSRTISESPVAMFNQTGQAAFDAESGALLSLALEISAQTEGAFDPTVEGLVTLWNICGEKDRLPLEDELQRTLSSVGYDRLHLSGSTATEALPTGVVLTRIDDGTTVDFGAIAKGYAIDCVLKYLESTAIPGGLLSFGGNIAVFGTKETGEPYQIGLRDPQNTSGIAGYLTLSSGVISVSGDYERYVTIQGDRYHHILDPKTGYPVNNGLHSVAVICENGALADALSTALFVMGWERAMAFYRSGVYPFEAIFMTNDEIILTEGIAASQAFVPSATGYTVVTGNTEMMP